MSEPILLTREQAAELCQVSPPKIDEWTNLPGFPVIRGPHFVRIHARRLEEWLAEYADQANARGRQPQVRAPYPQGANGTRVR